MRPLLHHANKYLKYRICARTGFFAHARTSAHARLRACANFCARDGVVSQLREILRTRFSCACAVFHVYANARSRARKYAM